MSFEIKSYDESWSEKLSKLRFGTTGLMNQSQTYLQSQKDDFLKGSLETPIFNYEHIRRHKFLELRDNNKTFLTEVIKDTSHHPIVKELYIDKLNERLKEIELVLLISDKQSSKDDENSLYFIDKFNLLNWELYGKPSDRIFCGVQMELKERLCKISAKNNTVSEQVDKFLTKYCRNFENLDPIERVYFDKSKINTRIPNFNTSEEIRKYFEKVLIAEGFSRDWSVKVDENNKRKIITVGYNSKTIFIPNNQHYELNPNSFALSSAMVQRMVVHEIGTHVKRAFNGFSSGLNLLGLGLANSRQAEEGLATYREQELVAENNFFSGYLSYFIIGLAYGLDRKGEKRSFRELFKVLEELFAITNFNNLDSAKHHAWDRCIRVFRGTSCRVPGLVLTKDLIYRTGNIQIHKFFNSKSEIKNWVDVGRFDPTNLKQVKSLKELGIIGD